MERATLGPWLVWLVLLAGGPACSSSQPAPGPWVPGQPLTVNVGAFFPPGTVVRDQYAGATATVDAAGSVTVTPDLAGVVLLESATAAPTPFTWPNATVYFAITDRFQNGDPANDGSYGRQKDGQSEIGTWHGGDWKGLTAKLDYLASLGVTAVWISPIVEQVHGWVGGGSAGDFKHHGYHGYWALDFTELDQNFGTQADLLGLVDGAHARGIRVLVDVVMNHPGYATGDDLVRYLPEVFLDGTGAAFKAWAAGATGNFGHWNVFVDYASPNWVNWWANALRDPYSTTTWVRAGFPSFQPGGNDDLTMQLSSLPDFKTEGAVPAGVPVLFNRKVLAGDTTGVVDLPGGHVRDYLVKWHADWVRQFGIDGFRCDTAKHVELASWSALKGAATTALADWKATSTTKIDDAPFWMTGEVFPHGVVKDEYYTLGGFDSLLNFDFQGQLAVILTAGGSLLARAGDLDAIYAKIAGMVSTDPTFDVLSYLSSHDTELFYYSVGYDAAKQRQAGTALLLAPGGAQIFYGDESGRRRGPSGSDPTQGTRSDMNWTTTDASILAHWQKLGTFRKRHAAIGAGGHARIASPDGTYAFGRKLDQTSPAVHDAVVVILTPAG